MSITRSPDTTRDGPGTDRGAPAGVLTPDDFSRAGQLGQLAERRQAP